MTVRSPRGARGYDPLGSAILLFLLLMMAGCAPNGAQTGPYPQFADFEGREVLEVRFEGELLLPRDELARITATRATRCQLLFIPVCIPGTNIGRDRYHLDLDELARDVARIQLFYRDHGYYGTRVTPSVDPTMERDGVAVRFRIRPGRRVVLEELDIEGTEGIVEPEALRERIPLRVGEPFRRIDFLASVDTIQSTLLREGHAYAQVLRNFSLDTIANVADVRYEAIPGPLVRVDTVLVEGAERLGVRAVRDQLTFREGDILRAIDLNRSQRNLYNVGFVAFAAIEIAPDEMQVDPDRAAATVLVRVVEAARYLVDATAGYGTLDCLRTNARWLDRNFAGSGRRLDITGSLSKLGVGAPTGAGLENSICPALEGDPFSEEMNYRLAADFEQPRLFRAGTRLTAGVHTERLSEAFAFQREATGGQLSVGHQLTLHDVVTTTAEVQRGRTLADPVVYCFGFEICTVEARAPLLRNRWSNALTLAGVHDRAERIGHTERGYRVRAAGTYSDQWMGSDDQFLRLLSEGTMYREIRPEWAIAGLLRGGTFVDGVIGPQGGFVPPERRFYAGGPNSVRGYPRNALGPRAYVTEGFPIDGEIIPSTDPADIRGSAIGGTETVEASVELRTPSPLFRDAVRLGFFVDAGQVWAPGSQLSAGSVRVTPGAGVRIGTPIGPIRIDLGYNPYALTSGPLYVRDGDDLLLVNPDFRPRDERGRLGRIQVHFAVGHAF